MEKIKVSKEQWETIKYNVKLNLDKNYNVIGYLEGVFEVEPERWEIELDLAREETLPSQVEVRDRHYENCISFLLDKIKALEKK